MQAVEAAKHAAVVREMTRVLKRGGRLVCCAPDWRTFQVDVLGNSVLEGGAKPELAAATGRLLGGMVPGCTAHPYLGCNLPRLLRKCGLRDVRAGKGQRALGVCQ